MPRLPSFWTLHILGWLAFGVIWYIASLPVYDELQVGAGMALVRVLINTSLGAFITLSFRPVYRLLWRHSESLFKISVIASVCSLVGSILWGIVFEYFKWPLDGVPFDEKPLSHFMRSFVLTAFLLFAWSLLYFGIKSRQKLQLETERALKAEALAHRARIDMLRYQLNPHFLFNALNSIRALVSENHEKARQMVSGLSNYLRFALLDGDEEISIGEEVEVIRHYLAIEKIRFEDRLEVSYQIDPEAEPAQIPALLIHPLVENALKHGMRTGISPLHILLEVVVHDSVLVIRVINTGSLDRLSNRQENSAGIGLQNVRERLNQLYPNRHVFRLFQEAGNVVAEIALHNVPIPRAESLL